MATSQGQRWISEINEAGDTVHTRNTQAGDPGDTNGEDTSEMTKAELQAELEARGLPTSGTKAELLERLAQ